MDATTRNARFSSTLMMAVGLGLAVLGLLVLVGVVSATITGDLPPGMGDWVIDNPTKVTDEMVFLLDGNVIVNSALTLQDSTIYIDWMMNPDNYHFNISAGGSVKADGSVITSSWGDGIEYSFKGKASFDGCTLEYALDGVQIYTDSVSFVDCTIGPCYNMGVHTVKCSPYFEKTRIYVPWGSAVMKYKTDKTWTWDSPLRLMDPMGLWVEGGAPTFEGLSVQVSQEARFEVEYTGTEAAAYLYIQAVGAPVLIDSEAISDVSGITVSDSYISISYYVEATAPGTNPQRLEVAVNPICAGIVVLNYIDVTITDVTVSNTYLSWYWGYATGGSSQNNWWEYDSRSMKVVAAIIEDYTDSMSVSVEFSNIVTSDGDFLFTHAFHPGYVDTGGRAPTFSSTVLVSGLDVGSYDRNPVIAIETGSSYDGMKTMELDFEVTGCSFHDLSGPAIYYSPSGGVGIVPGLNTLDVMESFLVDNCTFTDTYLGGNAFIYVNGIGENHLANTWQRHIELSDNTFADSTASAFAISGMYRFAPGSEELFVINNQFSNIVVNPWDWGRLFDVNYFQVLRFVGNTFSGVEHPYSSYIYDYGGDSNGLLPDDYVFENNDFSSVTASQEMSWLYIEFAGDLLFDGNRISDTNGFVEIYQVPDVVGTCTARFTGNDFSVNSAHMVRYTRSDEDQKDLILRIDNNTVSQNSAFFVDYMWDSWIDTYDNDGTILIADNDINNNTGGCIHAWGDVRVIDNGFFDNQGPLVWIDYINLRSPTIDGNIMANNVDVFQIMAKDRGFQLVPMRLADMDIDCTGTALLFVNMEITLDRVNIRNAAVPIAVSNAQVDAFTCEIDGSMCELLGDGRITAWWSAEVMVVWGDAQGSESGSVTPQALVVFYDSSNSYYSSGNAGDDGVLPAAFYRGWRVDLDGLFSYSPYTIKVAASGAANESMYTIDGTLVGEDAIRIVLWDVFKPVVAITDPLNDAIFGVAHFTVHGFVAEIGSGLAGAESSLDGGSTWTPLVVSGTGDWEIPLAGLPEGDTTVMVRARDVAGNVNTVSVTVIVDTVAPTVTIQTPRPLQVFNASAVTLTGDTERGVRLFVNGMPETVDPVGKISVPLVLNEGSNTIVVEAIDAAGNVGMVEFIVTLDTFEPVLVLMAPADSLLTREDTVVVKGIVEPGVSLTIGGTVVVPDPNGAFSKVVSLGQGKNTITVVAIDGAGNRNAAVRTVTLDSTPPAVQITAPKEGDKVTAAQITVRVSADPEARLYLNGRLLPGKGLVNRTVLLVEGSNTIEVLAVDPAGNEGRAVVHVVLDTRPPTLEITTPTVMEVWTNLPSIDVKGVAMYATDVIINGVPAVFDPVSGNFSQSVQLAPGENNLTVVATDGVNEMRLNLKVWLSVGRPNLIVDAMPALVTTQTVTVSGHTDVGIKKVTVKVGTETYTFDVGYDGKFLIALNLLDGQHTVEVSVTDVYGNTATAQTAPFTVKATKITGE